MAKVRNVLFVMADQLRADYLSAYGHPTLKTPNIDALAVHEVRFTRAYVPSPVCDPARMSYYTGRYVTSHGATWNNIPLSVGEWTLGDYVRPLGPWVGLVGKTHMRVDRPLQSDRINTSLGINTFEFLLSSNQTRTAA